MTNLWLPTIPYSLIDCINRVAAATGSPRYAMAASNADYNGHQVSVHFNDFRKYWLTEYWWAGREVLCRGSARECLRAGADEYKRGAKGTTILATNVPDEDVEYARSFGYSDYNDEIREAHNATWRDERFGEVNGAMRYEQQLGCPAVGFLANSKDLADYKAKVDAFFKQQRERTAACGADGRA